jgi:hypothetical protein
MPTSDRTQRRGQILPLFALALTALVLGAAVVVDGGYGLAQRRETQNAADFAAMAGTRIVGEKLTGHPPGAGTAANVHAAIESVLTAHDAQLVSAQYIDEDGLALGNVVGAASIPSDAFGVVVEARTNWRPFLLGAIGVVDWNATSKATAKTPGRSLGGGVMPVGIGDGHYDDLASCPVADLDDCSSQALTPGHLIAPGNFGWLAFGVSGQGQKCDWTNSLGMTGPPDDPDSCEMNNPYLQSQIGPPANSHGCCTAVGLPGSVDLIGGLTGNTWGDLSFYVDNQIPVWVPIYDTVTGNGSHADYHIVGFGAILFMGQGTQHAKWLQGSAIDGACPAGTEITGHDYCSAPGGAFTIDVTGEVRLIR